MTYPQAIISVAKIGLSNLLGKRLYVDSLYMVNELTRAQYMIHFSSGTNHSWVAVPVLFTREVCIMPCIILSGESPVWSREKEMN